MRQLKTLLFHSRFVAAKTIGRKMNGNLLYALKSLMVKVIYGTNCPIFSLSRFRSHFRFAAVGGVIFKFISCLVFLVSKFVCMHLVIFFFHLILFLGVFNFLFLCPVRAAMKNMVKVIVRTYFLVRTPVKWHLANEMEWWKGVYHIKKWNKKWKKFYYLSNSNSSTSEAPKRIGAGKRNLSGTSFLITFVSIFSSVRSARKIYVICRNFI